MQLSHRTVSGDPSVAANRLGAADNDHRVKFEHLEALENSLGQIKRMLDNSEEDVMVQLGFSNAAFEEPLNRFDMKVLACEIHVQRKENRFMTPKDVMMLTYQFTREPMNGTMIYKTIERLLDRGMIEYKGVVGAGKNISRMYGITEYGRRAFKMAILNARILSKGDLAAA
ncbi:hypothetical protein LB523_05400 [Mesorhizobium sp. ESP-6-4]|uniref:hypothetical protein n=1 Tax=Mesorhizobium sp. ESP-6-4 TaxID=2876624 RepID=UPI001CD01D97|nr:hypothetical protein [Mesorhizobium sp. ESP-6-4]MBZ9658472.1 hypothetical protein [Mesorhizobium sp. ESP-6-4]